MNDERHFDLKQLLNEAELPGLPQSAVRLLQLARDEDNGPTEFAAEIETDPGLASQILRFANSSYFNFSRKIPTIKLAITLIGPQMITQFALCRAIYSAIPNPRCGPFGLKNLWQDSLRRALFARAIGGLLGMNNTDELFIAALLQDMAVPLLVKMLPQPYEELFADGQTGRARLSQLENQRFGWNHATAAGIVARGWALPDKLAVLIESHTDENLWGDFSHPPTDTLVVGISALLPSGTNTDWTERERFDSLYAKIRHDHWPDPAVLLGRIDNEFQEFASVLKLAVGGRSLVEAYQASQPLIGA
jgi:HD-like signal output (HDOD) protein